MLSVHDSTASTFLSGTVLQDKPASVLVRNLDAYSLFVLHLPPRTVAPVAPFATSLTIDLATWRITGIQCL